MSEPSQGETPPKVEEKLEKLPAMPGVYLFIDRRGKPIYIGKAKSLKARVRSYFGRSDDGRVRFPFIVRHVRDLDWVVTASEKEALILENNLVKQHKPRFNVRLVDDKTFLSIKISTNEPFPRALLVRRVKKDRAHYFGPYSSASAIRQTLRTIRKFFPLRTCSNAEFKQRTRPCIQYDMGRCGAPCVGRESAEAYAKAVDESILFLKGRNRELVLRLRLKMEGEAAALRFEAAARLRDQIRAIEQSVEKQRIVRTDFRDRDVFGDVHEGGATLIQALFVREGKLISTHLFTFRSDLPAEEVFGSFLTQFYGADRFLPDEVVVPFEVEIEDRATLDAWLSERKGRRVEIVAPQRGALRDLVLLARENAAAAFRREEERRKAAEATAEGLREKLRLSRRPDRIECVDISTIMGVFAVGSLVAFEGGEPAKNRYRKFKIRTVERQDDLAMIGEVLDRRLKRAARDRDLPDRLLIDGGRGQLAAAEAAFARAGLRAGEAAAACDLASIAKPRSEAGRVVRAPGVARTEPLFVSGRDRSEEPVLLPEGSPEMHLLQRVRDEAHRFAIGYHRELRRARAFKTGLEEVPGVGPKRRKALLEHFGSLRALREASVADIAACPLITPAQADAIHHFFHEGEGAAIPDEGPSRDRSSPDE